MRFHTKALESSQMLKTPPKCSVLIGVPASINQTEILSGSCKARNIVDTNSLVKYLNLKFHYHHSPAAAETDINKNLILIFVEYWPMKSRTFSFEKRKLAKSSKESKVILAEKTRRGRLNISSIIYK